MKLSMLFLVIGITALCALLALNFTKASKMEHTHLANKPVLHINDIAAPAGFHRTTAPGDSGWYNYFRHVSLKSSKTVYLYNGHPKVNQSAQYAVLDIPVGHKDLQQCADAVIRLHAEYAYGNKNFKALRFLATDGTWMEYTEWIKGFRYLLKNNRLMKSKTAAAAESRTVFDQFMETVFIYAGTISLSRQAQKLPTNAPVRPGDALIDAGSPGHAVVVVDVAEDSRGNRVCLLAQSFMPAQDIHILQHYGSVHPWYVIRPGKPLNTPEWYFPEAQLYRLFPKGLE